MVLFANALLGVPLVKLVGAWTLVVIALNVRAQRQDAVAIAESSGSASDFLSAAAVIMVADAAMSLDNVVALAAIAQGNYWLLAIGVLMSIPIIAYGAFILTGIIGRAPEILTIGAAFLGWIAGAMAVSDPLIAGWVDANAPGLGTFAPALVALFVLAAGRGPEPRALPAGARARLAWPAPGARRSPALSAAGANPCLRRRTRAACGRAAPAPGRSGARLRHRLSGGDRSPGLERRARRRRGLRAACLSGRTYHFHRLILRQPDLRVEAGPGRSHGRPLPELIVLLDAA